MKRIERIAAWIVLAIAVGVIGAVIYPLTRHGFFVSDDGNWMIIRLSAFYQAFREGQFPVRFLGRLNFSYGYPVANFLYPGFMYVGSVIHVLGFPFVETVKIIFGVSVVISGIFTYLWLRSYFSRMASTIGTITLVSAPYFLYDIYHRGSVGEVLAIAWAAVGLWSIASKKFQLLSVAVALLIISHNSLALLFIGLFVCIISAQKAWKEAFLWFSLGIGAATFFWFPALYETKYVVFASKVISDPTAYFLTIPTLALVGYAGVVSFISSLAIAKPTSHEKTLFTLLAILSVLMVLPVSAPVWHIPLVAHLLQFPYRILSVTIFLWAWFAAYAAHQLKRSALWTFVVGVIVINVWSVHGAVRQIQPIFEPEGYYTTNEATTTVADEYMPKWVDVKPSVHASARFTFYSGKGTITENFVNTQTIDITVHASEPSVLQINTVYYPGWGATLDDSATTIHYDNKGGLMRIDIPSGDHHLVMGFHETISRFFADTVSLVSVIWFAVAGAVSFRKRKK